MVRVGDLTKDGDSSVLAYPFYQTRRINRTATDAAGDVSYTGIGFIPRMIMFNGVKSSSSAATDTRCIGFSSETGVANNDQCYVASENGSYLASGQYSFISYEGLSLGSAAYIKSFDDDGFTLTWIKQGAPSGNLAIMLMIFG